MTPFVPASVPEFLALSYRPDLHLLVSRWRRPVTGAEFRQGYRATLALARQVGCPYWLVDLRGRNVADPTSQQWLTERFLPRVSAVLALPVCLGYLLSPQQLRQLAAPAADTGRVALFASEGPLSSWLTTCQHRTREALAEAGCGAAADTVRA